LGNRVQRRIVVRNDVTNGDAEIRHLRSSINDLISLQTLPAIWDGREPGSIVSTLLDVLASMLRLDFAYVRLNDTFNGSPLEFLQLPQRRALPPQTSEIGRALDRWLTKESVDTPRVVPHPAGDGEVRIAPFRLGLKDEIGVLVVSSKRTTFPTPTETLLLRTAGNQALVALQEARQLHEQKRAAEELERRVAERTAQLTATNEALRESEKKYRTLFDSIDEGFCTIEVLFDESDHPVDYRFLEVNPSFEKQTGIQNARGRRMREIAPHHEDHWFQIYGQIALTGEPVRFENRAAELRRWYDVFAFRIGEPGERKVAMLFKDITAHKQAEARLLLNEAYLSEAQRLSHTGSFGWRPSNGQLLWTEETFRIFQYEQTVKPTVELILQRIHPDDATLVKETIDRASQDGKGFDFEHRLLMPDGSAKHLRVVAHAEKDQSGEIEFVGAVMDVTVAKEAADNIRLIINTVPGLLWTARPDGWVDFLNQRWLDYTGMTLEQGLGWAWQPGYHPDDLGNLLIKWRAAIAERKPLDVEARLRRFDGEYRWFLKRAFPLFDNAGRVLGWYGGNIDIHDLKQAEVALRRIETYLSEGQRLSHTGSWAWSVKTKENLYWSREHYRIYGFDPDTESGQYDHARERIHPEDGSVFDKTLQQAILKESDFEMDFRIVLPGGELKHIHVVGHPVLNNTGELVEYIGTTMDVTEQVKARAALEEAFSKIKKSEARLQTIIDTIPTLAWSTEPDGSVEFVNLRWRNYTGLSTEQARGSGWEAAIHPADIQWLSDQRRITMASGKPFELEARMRRYDGQYRWFINRADPLLDEQGKILKWYGTNTDIDDRKLAEEALRRSENYLAEAQRLTHTGSWVYNISTGKLVHSSEEHRRLFGFDPEKGIPSFDELILRIHPEDRTLALQEFETITPSAKDFDAHFRIVLPDGTMKYVYGTGHPIFNPSGDVREFVGMVMDVTERKRAELALRRSENYLAEAQKLSHTGSWARSLATGEITYWSEECYRVLGFDPHAGLPQFKTFLQRVYPEDQEKVRKTAATATHEKVGYEVEYRIVHPGGQKRDVHAVGHPVFGPSGDLVEYVGTVIDITERKRAEEALRASERELRLITESIPGMVVVNSPEGDNEYANQRLLDFLGKKLADMNELKWLNLVHPEDSDSVMNKWLHAIKTGRPMDVIYRMRRADGVYRWFQSRVEPLVDVQGRILRWYGLLVDVDDQVKAEEALRKSQADLAHVSRVTTMGELTASIAHEVNQPLTAVVNNANACISLLPNGAPNLEEIRQALTEMIEDADRASGVIARVRQLAKRAPIEKSLLDLREVVQEVLALARYESAARNVTIRTDLPKDLPSVSGDRVQLQQVLLNLVINGMDAMNKVEEGKRFLIIYGCHEIQDGVAMALVSVQDSGTGFKPGEKDRLFEAFYTTKPQGMGMGLAISRSIIETHGGRLWAEANPGAGATFAFSLPVAGYVAS
jgi:PAS domain S-box-containing protein